jgi:AraC family transcriptional regulator, regulatory protein of adaptative response / methylated-DNA-[protein]-cysteine methyltransferase
MIGAPRSARAVARACASNRLAIVVPCHRVVPAAGGIGQYRWGAGRKAALLDAERGVEARPRHGKLHGSANRRPAGPA